MRSQSGTGWIANLVLFLSSVVVGLLLIEIGIRFVAPQPMNGVIFEYAPRGYSINRSKGTALFSTGESKGIYHFQPPHLRGVRPPAAGAVRILALGDSFTFGVGLPEEDTYVAKLQEKIDLELGADRIALLNAGTSGSGTAEHLAFVEDFGDEIAPRAVFVFVSIDDFNRAQRSPLYRLQSANTLELDEANAPTNWLKRLVSGSDAYNFAIQHVHIAQLIRNFVIRLVYWTAPQRPKDNMSSNLFSADQSGSNSRLVSEQQRLVRALFRRMKEWCGVRGVELAVINNGWQSYDWLADLLASENIAFFDAAPRIEPVVKRDPALYTIQGDGHPNAKGAALVAETVWPFVQTAIRENNLDKNAGQP